MIVLMFFTSRISHFNHDIFMINIFPDLFFVFGGLERMTVPHYVAMVFEFGIILTPL